MISREVYCAALLRGLLRFNCPEHYGIECSHCPKCQLIRIAVTFWRQLLKDIKERE